MHVAQSAFLAGVRPRMKELLTKLGGQYRFASLLAEDCSGGRAQISAQGASAGEDPSFTSRGFVARVADEKGYAEYSFNSLADGADIDAALAAVKDSLLPLGEGLTPETVFTDVTPPADGKLQGHYTTEYKADPDAAGAELMARLTALREKGLGSDERILDCPVRLSWQHIHKLYLSGETELEQDLLWTDGMVAMMAARGDEIKFAYDTASDQGGLEVADLLEGKLEGVKSTLLGLLESEPIVPGEYECICDPAVTGMIVHEAFGHGVEMDMFVKDRALAKYTVGQRVASDLVTMHDGAAVIRDTGSYFFDDEGTPAHDTLIIEKGILKRGISDLLSANVLGTEPTGNGRREDFTRKAYTRMTNTYFEGGTDSPEDMIASIPYGFLLELPESGMEDPKNWGIQMMVSVAKEIRDGKLTGKVFSPIVMTGYVPDLLKSISMMSPEVKIEGSGFCGKGYKEWVKVSDGGPYIKARVRLG